MSVFTAILVGMVDYDDIIALMKFYIFDYRVIVTFIILLSRVWRCVILMPRIQKRQQRFSICITIRLLSNRNAFISKV